MQVRMGVRPFSGGKVCMQTLKVLQHQFPSRCGTIWLAKTSKNGIKCAKKRSKTTIHNLN
jgi:hypothetical protein